MSIENNIANGIDLGTTYSCVNIDISYDIIANDQGERIIIICIIYKYRTSSR